MIVDRIEKIAQDIHNYYTYQHPTRELNLLCTLKGAVMFFEHLTGFLRAFSRYETIDLGRPTYIEHYIKASSYTGMTRECTVQLSHFSPSAAGSPTSKGFFRNKDVVIVEDILDSGNTLKEIKRALKDDGANSVCSTVLFTKRVNGNENVEVEWSGFSVPNEFVLGFGCDLKDHFRDLEHLCVISQRGRDFYLGAH
eukprot:Protomagalhaensia_wolfi_Nauph_80__1072@NODE_1624_length_1434_cov_366_383513_g1258_i0_p1_GENE_NODE_1624_length_1434_cov_366_383513_g1258_i0NODE_1624_length_1434_cov_366_383513_g1258_i0_p1_ORF_typecomplete_len196_score35_66Pribosyltran/PF00156_27/4_2e14Pribosyl_synth/PF14572_6/0_00018PRTase_3/PF15610_6/0_0088PRTase_2/PF15609_6/0_23_NODE_1624_length_1434_cov_366_383513_g1258_i0116703